MQRLTLVLVSLLTFVGALAVSDAALAQRNPYEGSPEAPAPPFADGLDWINVESPLTLEQLRGKVVLLDFWTYGCINCIHLIPTLDALEEKYADELVVIGVHSAKFDNEGETQNIRDVVQRYERTHPVINDSDFIVWRTYERFLGRSLAWPTLVLIDPRGNTYAAQSGEIPFAALDDVIGNMVTYFDTQGELDRTPLETIAPELASAPPRALNFPGKVLVDLDGNRLFIADSVNHRVVIAALDSYEVLDLIGTGAQGYADGDYDTAQFYKPQGMALLDDTLYLADTFNHTIREINLTQQIVTTIAGTGIKGEQLPQTPTFYALNRDLLSPWDLAFGADDNLLYVASAGTHQIWSLDLAEGTLSYAVGNAREANLNTTLLGSELAQPSGLYYDAGELYFADSESSTIRVADINADVVSVVSGTTDNSLFDYGDTDGAPGESRLQHPLGITGDGADALYIADTYNSKIKLVSGDELVTETLSGGAAGYVDGALAEARFNEPGGLQYADGKLYIADTNNHLIRVIDLAAETVETIVFPNPEALQIDGRATVIAGNQFSGAEALASQTVAAGDGEIVLSLLLPEGYKINDLAPSQAVFAEPSAALTLTELEWTIEDTDLSVPVTFSEGEATLFGSFDVYYCEAVNESLCFIERFAVELPLTVTDGAGSETVSIEREINPPETDFATFNGS